MRVVPLTEQLAPFVSRWDRQVENLIGDVLSGDAVDPLVRPLYEGTFQTRPPRVRTVDSPYVAAALIATGELGIPRLADDKWINCAVTNGLVGDGRFAFDISFTIWTVLARERSRVHARVEDSMRWSAGLQFGVFDDWCPIYQWVNSAHPELISDAQRELLRLSWHLGWFWTFEDVFLVCHPPVSVERVDAGPRVMFRDGWLAVP